MTDDGRRTADPSARTGWAGQPRTQSFSALLAALPSCISTQFVLMGDPVREVTGIADDSRAVQPGSCFVAYRGVEADGHAYIPAAIARGASVIVCEHSIAQSQSPGSPATLVVPNGREAFAWLCAAWHGFPSRQFKVVGITGTDGKTTTSTILFNILKAAGHKVGLISTVSAIIGDEALDTGLHTTTPDADELQALLARMRDAGATHCVLEVTSHGLAHHRVDGTHFDVAVITNITRDHINLHGTREAYRAAKTRLFKLVGSNGTAILNVDDHYSFAHLARVPVGGQIIYSQKPGAQLPDKSSLVAQRIHHTPHGLEFHVQMADGSLHLRSPLLGDFNVSNILAAAGAARALGAPSPAIIDGVAATTGIPGRMERIDSGQAFTAIVDFAHTPNALENCLATLNRIKGARALIAVFGCAGERDEQKRPRMAEIASRMADAAIFTAEDPRRESIDVIFADMIAGVPLTARAKVRCIPDRFEALRAACAMARAGDILVACGKGHEQSMCFGTRELPWDDRVQLRRAIEATRD